MSKLKRAVAATATAVGLTLGAFAVAPPASAVPVAYDCGVYGALHAEYSYYGDDFELYADLNEILPGEYSIALGEGSTATWDGPPPVTVPLMSSFFQPDVLYGTSSAASTGAPDTINLWIPSPPAPPPGLMITCQLIP